DQLEAVLHPFEPGHRFVDLLVGQSGDAPHRRRCERVFEIVVTRYWHRWSGLVLVEPDDFGPGPLSQLPAGLVAAGEVRVVGRARGSVRSARWSSSFRWCP